MQATPGPLRDSGPAFFVENPMPGAHRKVNQVEEQTTREG
jgi:hypothetical protein